MGLRAPIPGLLGWLPKDASYWLCVLLFGKQLHTYTYSLTRRHIPSVLSSFPHLLLSYAISLRITWAFLSKIRQRIKESRSETAAELISDLNPMIRGWAMYHRHVVSKNVFHDVDHAIFQALWAWARRRHRNKPRRWIKAKYFCQVGLNHWVFTGMLKEENGQMRAVRLLAASSIRIQRHTKIRAGANPHDPTWEPYFEKRLDLHMAATLKGKRWLLHLWKEQAGL